MISSRGQKRVSGGRPRIRPDSARFRLVLVLAILSIALVAATALPTKTRIPRIIYNASGSAPVGFYRGENRMPLRGDTAVIQPSKTLESLLVSQAFLPPGIPLLKRVAAVAGDRVCRSGGVVFVNGVAVAEALERARNGRPLPIWEGCLTLSEGQFFLIQPHYYSLDSRYFGPVNACQIIGVAHVIWTWTRDQ
jgi:conjugative transfer signal peptidase TraF